MKTAIIIEARLTSNRFPNKVLANLNGKPVLQHILDELTSSQFPVIVAIPKAKSNDVLASWLAERDIRFYRGHEIDVMNRFYECAKAFKVKTIIRVCADSPFIFRSDLSRLLYWYWNQSEPYRMIWGMGFWIFDFDDLEYANNNIIDAMSREHVVRPFTMTIDYPEDIKRLQSE